MRVTPNTVTDDAVGFDGLRAVVGAGDGVVGRFPGIVCVARCSDPEPLREFLAVCAEVAGPEPGRPLARRLATWMSGPDAPGPELRFGTVAAAGDKLAVYLVGDVEARVDAVGGLTLSGAHAAIGTDRLLPPPTSPVVLSMDGGEVRADPADVHDLRGGVVPGAGVVLRPTGFGLDEVRHAEDGAGGVHEWFDTGKNASDPFGDPPPAPDVPVQRAPAVGVGGRNGVAREAGAQAVDEPEVAEDGSAGPGRHALDPPLPPPPQARLDPLTDPLPDDFDGDFDGDDLPRRPRPAPGGQGGIDAPRPPSSTSRDVGQPSDPAAWEGGAPRNGPRPATVADHAAAEGAPPVGTSAGHPSGRQADGFPDAPTGEVPPDGPPPGAPAGSRPGADRRDEEAAAPRVDGRRPPTSSHALDAAATPSDPPRDVPTVDHPPEAAAPPERPRGVSQSDGEWREGGPSGGHALADRFNRPPQADEAFSWPPQVEDGFGRSPQTDGAFGRSPHGFGRSPEAEDGPRDALPVRSRAPGRLRPGETPASSLFAPAQDQPRGALDLAPATPPAGFAPPPHREPETRPPPPTAESTASPLFQTPDDPATSQRRGPRIRGYRCENGHLNDPRAPRCRECAAPIDERVGGLVAGPRPALGTLVFDDGAAHVVDGGYLLGGRPDADDRVRTGELRPIVVADDSVAHAHAEIRVSGWDVLVVDAGSRDGTYVSGPEEGRWTPLPPRRSRRLLPGTRVRLGARTFVFESTSTVR